MHNAKPTRPGSRYNADNKTAVIDPKHYPFLKYPTDATVQPGDRVEYMDEDGAIHTGTVLADGAYLLDNALYVRVDSDEFIDAVAASALTKVFDYETLDSETRIVVQQKTSEIKTLMRRTTQDIIDIGNHLIVVKNKLEHGRFGKWLSAEFSWEERTARRFMSVATVFKTDSVSDLTIGAKALYLLAAPSTPDEARQEVLELAKTGVPITYPAAKAIVSEHKGLPPVVPAPQPAPSAAKAYDDANRTFAPVTRPPAVTYSKSEDDYQDDVPSTDADEPDWLDDALSGKEADAAESTTFQIGDKVSTAFGRKGGEIIELDPLMGALVKFPGSTPWWLKTKDLSKDLVLVERPAAAPPAATPAPAYAHHLSGSNEWYTPKAYVEAVRQLMTGITLDPASCELANQTVKASNYYCIENDGMAHPWAGNVFLNPPYGLDDDGESNVALWTAKLVSEFQAKRIAEAVLLVNATTERKWFQALWQYPICFTDHRINFYNAEGQQKQPTQGNAFIYFGEHVYTFAEIFRQFGTIVKKV